MKTSVRSEPAPPQTESALNRSDIFQSGIASWYGDDFHGKTTANGEIYDMHKLTAAHQTLPFHTIVEVENLENRKKVLVRINDRGPFLKNRIIDLSHKAAQKLAMTETGTAMVNIRVVSWSGTEIPEVDVASGSAECRVQAGAFNVRENAEDLLLTLEDIFPDLKFSLLVEEDLFKVVSEKMPAADACQAVVKKLAEYGLQGFIRNNDQR